MLGLQGIVVKCTAAIFFPTVDSDVASFGLKLKVNYLVCEVYDYYLNIFLFGFVILRIILVLVTKNVNFAVKLQNS